MVREKKPKTIRDELKHKVIRDFGHFLKQKKKNKKEKERKHNERIIKDRIIRNIRNIRLDICWTRKRLLWA